VRITLVAVAAKDPIMELPVPAAEWTFSTSPALTRITPYGPDGKPGRITPLAALGTTAPGSALAAAGTAVRVGRLWVSTAVGWRGVGEAVGGGVTGGAVGVDKRLGVAKGVDFPTRESVQALWLKMTILAAKRIRVRFISLSFSVGAMPTCFILSLRPTAGRNISN